MHVKDTVKAFKNAGLLGIDNKIYNIGSGKHKRIIDIAKLFGKKMVYIPKRKGEINKSCANILKAGRELNWSPKITLKRGINELIKNYKFSIY